MPRPGRSQTTDRASKVAQIQKATQAADRRRATLIWGAAALVVALIIGAVVYVVAKESPDLADLSGVQTYEYEAAVHNDAAITYAENPPVGGPHHNAWWNCGVYDQELPKEHAVHSLEHGTVWLTYQPTLPADQIEVLKKLGNQEFMLVSPMADQSSPVVATAWNHQLTLDSADQQTLTKFVRTYKQGPTTPELGAACTGGTVTDLVDRS
ncbi:MAG: DUF3105 domain-containing protein [Ornithinimicrobium sp.]|uniref:DUF3105 domain-containing protein n=1 Tax=Ornithinimicrobium sp. TaxID=1977084 RepID=UPI0026DFD402|nr:DUF3105 domain-containing protein [Ornithinimicrobium sp.]MDO5738968.1 DUF3105 domain-containing protein [Ornithinimicrobium sp.]